MNKLSLEPSVAQGYCRRLPALGRKLRFLLFFSIKVDPLNVESQKSQLGEMTKAEVTQA